MPRPDKSGLAMTGERGELVIPGEDPESRKRDHLKFRWIPPFGGMTEGIKGDTPLNPRFKGVSPLWTPQNGERPVWWWHIIK